MRQPIPFTSNAAGRVFTACVLSFNILITPIAAVAATYKKPAVSSQKSAVAEDSKAKSAVADVFAKPLADSAKTDLANTTVPAALPAPAPLPAAPPVGNVTASLAASLLAGQGGVDADADGKADPGDTIAYTLSLANASGAGATGLAIANPLDSHTTLVGGTLNSTPVAFDQSVSLNEDATLVITLTGQDPDGTVTPNFSFKKSDGTAFPGNPTTIATAHGTIGTFGSVTCDANGVCSQQVTYTPALNYSGSDSFSFKANDNTANSNENGVVTITVNPVNDAPTFTLPSNPGAVNEDNGLTTVTDFITGIRPAQGPPPPPGSVLNSTEDTQNVSFVITNITHSALFTAGGQPVLTVQNSGNQPFPQKANLTYTPAPNANGTSVVTYHLHDNGGTANSGVDNSADQTFTITVNAVNDLPVVDPVAKAFTVQANMRSVGFTGLLANATDPDATNANADALSADAAAGYTSPTFTLASITGTCESIVANPATGAGPCKITITSTSTGTFTFDPPPGVTGAVTLNYTISDNGNPGSATSLAGTINLTVNGPVIWFVDPTRTNNGNGTLSGAADAAGNPGPFKSLALANNAINLKTGQRVFVYSGTTAAGESLDLSGNNNWLVGQGTVAANFDTFFGLTGGNTPPAATVARPTLNSAPATAFAARPQISGTVTMRNNTQVTGVKVVTTGATAGLRSVGFSAGTSLVKDVSVTTATGNAVDFSGTQTITYETSDNTNSPNVLVSVGGIALTVSGTVSAGANGFTFKSISANGGTKGIVFNNTGTAVGNGGITITGDGSTAGSGGTIQNTSTRGAEFVTAKSISLNRMNFTGNGTGVLSPNFNCGDGLNASISGTNRAGNCQSNIHLDTVTGVTLDNLSVTNSKQNGINGYDVTGFSLTNSTVTGNGDEVGEDGVQIANLKGNANVITNCTIKNNAARSVEIQDNLAGATTITITGGLFGNDNNPTGATTPSTSTAADTILMATNGSNSASLTSVIKGATFQKLYGRALNSNTEGNTSQNVTFGQAGAGNGNTVSNVSYGTDINGTTTGSVTFSIVNNVFTNTPGSVTSNSRTVINARKGFGATGLWTGTISGNTIGTSGVSQSGCDAVTCGGISADAPAISGNFDITITNNTIRHVNGHGIFVAHNPGAANSGGSVHATVTGNTLNQPDDNTNGANGNQGDGINVTTTGTNASINAKVGGAGALANNVTDNWHLNGGGSLRGVRFVRGNTTTFCVSGFSGPFDSTSVQNYITTQNTGNAGSATQPVGQTGYSGPSCTTPLMLARGGVLAGWKSSSLATNFYGSLLASCQSDSSSDSLPEFTASAEVAVASLTQSQLDSTVTSAIERWSAAGLTPQQIDQLKAIRFEVANLNGSYLGEANGAQVQVDTGAQGKGWFIDTTPQDDAEFKPVSATRSYTDPFSAPAGHVDLLTAIMHEMGHKLGLDDSYLEKDRDSLMYGYLTVGERRLPEKGQAVRPTAGGSATSHFLALEPSRIANAFGGVLTGAGAAGTEVFDKAAAEISGQRSEVSDLTGVRGQKSEVRSQKSGVRLNHARANSKLKTENSRLAATVAPPPTPVGSFPINGTGLGAGFSLPDGKSITITFKATLNSPPNFASYSATQKVTAQATLTGSFVGNPLLSDDPSVGGAADATSTNVDLYDSTTTVVSSANPANTSQSITFTATIGTSGTPNGSATARTGTVNFKDNGTSIPGCGSQPVSSNQATCTTSGLSTGSHPIAADYSGDGNFDPSTAALSAAAGQNGTPQVINKSGTNATLTSSLNPSTVTQNVTFTATITTATSVPNPTGSVVFKDGINPISCSNAGGQTLNGSGVATCQISTLGSGNHPITADYSGDGNFNVNNGIVLTGGSPAGNQTVNKATPSVTLVSSTNPSFVSQNVIFTATVSAPGGVSATPTGTLTFRDGGVAMICTGGAQSLSGGVATCHRNNLSAGSHTITVDYPTDTNFNAVSGTGMTAAAGQNGNPQVVNQSNTTMTVSSSVNPSKVLQSVKFTLNIKSASAVAGPPTGNVNFWDGAVGGTQIGGTKTLGTSSCADAQSACVDSDTTTSLTAGTHTITVEYLGDANFSTNAQTLSGGQVVNKSDTSVNLGSSGLTPNVGDSVTFTATVSGSAVPPAIAFDDGGTVDFKDGATTISGCGGVLINASHQAACTTTALPAGARNITAVYNGDGAFNGSTSNTVVQQVGPTCASAPVVMNTSDNGTGSLRKAIADACVGATITFDATAFDVPGAPHFIDLIDFASPVIGGELAINKDLTITGPGSNVLTVRRASGASTKFRIFNVSAGAVTISGMTISNGSQGATAQAPGSPTGAAGTGVLGGGIYNSTTLNLQSVIISGNSITGGDGGDGTGAGDAGGVGGAAYGGGIFNSGTLTLTNSTVNGSNSATGGKGGSSDTTPGAGGGAFGGGVYNTGGLTLTNSTIASNTATGGTGGTNTGLGASGSVGNGLGGGVYNDADVSAATTTITNTTISGNIAGTGGGGVYNFGATGVGTLSITGSTISGNAAPNGAGIYNSGTGSSAPASITNSTISGNLAGNTGGGLYNDSGTSTVTLTSVTITGNQADSDNNGVGSGGGGGIKTVGNNVTLKNTIVAGNFSTSLQVETVTVTTGASGTVTKQAETITVTGSVVRDGDIRVTVTAAPPFTGSPKIFIIPLTTAHDTSTDVVADDIKAALIPDSDINGANGFEVTVVGSTLTLAQKTPTANDGTMHVSIAGSVTGINNAESSPSTPGGAGSATAGNKQAETITVASPISGCGTVISVIVTADTLTGSPVTLSVPESDGRDETQVADDIRAFIQTDGTAANVKNFFTITGAGTPTILFTKNQAAANDPSMHVQITGDTCAITTSESSQPVGGNGVAPVQQEETVAVSGAPVANDGSILVVVTAANMSPTTKNVTVPLTVATDTTNDQTAADIAAALTVDGTVGGFFNVSSLTSNVILQAKVAAADDNTMHVSIVGRVSGIANAESSHTPPGTGNAKVTITADPAYFYPPTFPGTKTVTALVTAGDNADAVAVKLRDALNADPDVSPIFLAMASGPNLSLTRKVAATNDATLAMATDCDTCTGLTPSNPSVNTKDGGTAIPDDISGSVAGGSTFNLIGDTATAGGLSNGVGNNLVGVASASVLDPLGNYGGPTQTHKLKNPGPAIDQGFKFSLTTDQRGLQRFVDLAVANASGGDGSDIGAFEDQGPTQQPTLDLTPANVATTRDSTPDFSAGNLVIGATVVFKRDTTVLSTVTASSSTMLFTDNTLTTDGGPFDYTVTQTVAGSSATSSPRTVTVNTQPSVPDLIAGDDSAGPGTIGTTSDNITKVTTPTFTGGAPTDPNTTIRLFANGTQVGSTTSDPSGIWSITTSVLSAGSYTITAREVFGAFEGADGPGLVVVIDTSVSPLPSAPVLDPADDSGAPDSVTNQPMPTFKGAAGSVEANSKIQLFANAVLVGTGVANGSGAWSVATSALSDGTYSMTAVATDIAGNVSAPSGGSSVTIDTQVAAPSTPDLINGDDSGAFNNDNYTNKTTPTFTGTAETGSDVKLFAGAVQVGSGTATGGNWSITIPLINALTDGTYQITVTATDPAGNISAASTALSVTIDTVVPPKPSTPDLAAGDDTGAFNTDNITKTTTPSFSGTAEISARIDLFKNSGGGPTLAGTGNADGSGNWNVLSGALADNTYQMTVVATDLAGNQSVSSDPLSVTIDTAPPPAPLALALLPADDTGTSASDGITKKNTPTFTGTAETNSIVQLFAGVTPVGSGTAAGGNFSIVSGLLPDNSYNMTAQATDLAGNTGPASAPSVPITIDTVKPTVTMSSVAGNPTATSPIPVTVLFSENVFGFDASDVAVSNATSPVTNFLGSNANYSFDLTPTAAGGVSADIGTDMATDKAGNGNTAAVQFNRTYDPSALNATITPISPNPRNTAVSTITIVFNKPVTGFDLADLSLKLNGGAELLPGGATLNTSDNATWTLDNLAGLTAAQGTYDLKLTAAGSGIQDSTATALASDATASWVMDTTAPTVTVNQAVGQTDPFTGPTGTTIINFTAIFSESVTGLTPSGVTISGTANPTVVNVTGSGTTYNLAVQGMSQSGTVIASVKVSAATDSAGNGNAVSTSVDNTVQFNADNFSTIEVNTTADTDDGSCNPLGTGSGNQDCTLREAINAANADFGAETITFNSTVFAAPGPYTINLGSVLPNVTTDMTINGPGANVLTVKRNAVAHFRIFFVDQGATASISGLTLSNGLSQTAAGIKVNNGTLTLTRVAVTGNTADQLGGAEGGGAFVNAGCTLNVIESTFSGNQAINAGSEGGAIFNGGTLTITNSTISGNSADLGAGLYADLGTTTISNSTLTANTASTNGGGIHRGVGAVTLKSTIVGGNSGPAGPDINGAVDSEGYNLIQNTSGATINETLNPGTNITGQDPQLNPLADNGGPTKTHSLLCTSPAIDKGFKFTTTTDQRGSTRPFDFAEAVYPNAAAPGEGSDIGAFETQSAGGCVPLAIAPSPAPTTNEDNPVVITLKGTYSQNINLSFAITQNPAIGQLGAISGPSCNYDNGNLLMTCTATVTYTPNSNANGADLFKFKVSAGGLDSDPADVDVTVNALNDPPTFLQAGPQTVLEDAGPQSAPNFITVFSPGPPDESGQTVQFNVTGNTNPGLFSAVPAIDGTGTLTYTPAANSNGSATITIVAKDNGGGTDTSAPQSFTITVLSVNDAPSFTIGPDQTVLEDAGAQIINGFATGISVGPAQESAQTAQFIITNNTNPGMFTEGPVISPTGKLTYISAPDANGTATITVVLKDNGGTANGGEDTSPAQTFTINVTPVNDQPTLNAVANVTIDEDAALQTINLSGISTGGGETQTLVLSATSNNPALIPNPTVTYTSPNATGSISFKPVADQNGFATITLAVKDDGGNANGGSDTVVRTFVVQVNAVNDAPVNVLPGPQTVTENSSLVFALSNSNSILVTDVDAAGSQVKVTLTATNGLITLGNATNLVFVVGDGTADPTMTFVGSLLNINGAMQGLKFTPPNGFSGAASLQIITDDQGDHGSGGSLTDTDTLSITVSDGGTLQFSAATYSVSENNGPAVITLTRTGGSAGTATVEIATSNGTATAGSDYTTVSQTVSFGIGETSKTVSIPITDEFINEPDETVNLTLSNAGGSGALGALTTAVLTITNDDPAGGYLKFSAPTYSVAEGGVATITVQRVGTLTQAVSVDFATNDNSDPPSLVPCAPIPGNTLASSRCDFTSTFGRLTWAAGDGADKTFKVMTTQDNYVEGPETLNLTLFNPSNGAAFSGPSTEALTITDDLVEPSTNPIDDSDADIEQLYRDFLNRPSDPSGKAFWVNVINHCNDPAQRPPGQTAAQCIQIARIVAGGAFFLSNEFQGTGGTAYLTNKASYGGLPTFARFERDAQQIGQGYVFGAAGAEALLEANKVAYYNDYVTRTEFVNTYGGLSNQQYVDTLIQNTGVSFTPGERNQLVNGLNNATETRATVLRKITEKPAFKVAEFNSMFVLMEYFGFLRRNPDQAGFNFWLNKLNQANGDYFAAEMVKAFIESSEYRQRFGQ